MLHGRKAGREMGRHAAKGCRLKSDRLLSILSIFTYCAIKAISQKIIRKKGGPYPFCTAFNSVEIFNQSLNNRFFKKGRKKPHLMWTERGELRRSINHDGGRGCR